MTERFKDKVAIIGMGCTPFGELWDKDVDDLMVDATTEALEDAGVELKDIQAVWAGTANSGVNGSAASAPLQLQYIPVTRVENACATGIETIRNAAHALAAGHHHRRARVCVFAGDHQGAFYAARAPRHPRRKRQRDGQGGPHRGDGAGVQPDGAGQATGRAR